MHHCLMVESRHSVEVMLLCVRGELHLVYGRKVVSSLKFQRMYGMVTTMHHQCSWHLTCCKLAPSLPTQMWHHQ